LYLTHDGGSSWSQQNLALPASYEKYRYLPQAPVFFGQDGFLPLTIYRPEAAELTFYTSHDGGLTWGGNPAAPAQRIKACLPALADALHIWCWDGGPTLFTTRDGAQTWDETRTSLDLSGNLSQLELVPGITAWALTRLDQAGRSQLYRTSNGTNWEPLIP
jgi:hypothetical protein